MVPSAMRRRMVLDREGHDFGGFFEAEVDRKLAWWSRRRPLRVMGDGGGEEPADLGDSDIEPSAAREPDPVGADTASSPVADGALWGADERAELLEGEQSGVVPVGWDLDGVHGLWHDLFLSMEPLHKERPQRGRLSATFGWTILSQSPFGLLSWPPMSAAGSAAITAARRL